MAQTFAVRLTRNDASPWGFRLQGGKDFGAPLSILKVNGGSIAEKAGLQAGDGVLKINNVDAALLRHKEAQDAIIHAGNSFELLVQRGSVRTWQPKVTPVGEAPTRPQPASAELQPVTQTSLAANPDQVNGTMKTIVNKQYNSPVGLYSEENIAETLSAQAEVLVGGVLGVNFKKNEKPYSGDNSEVLKMVQQMDSEPMPHDHGGHSGTDAVGDYDDPALAPPHDKGLFGTRTSQSRTFKYLSEALHQESVFGGKYFPIASKRFPSHIAPPPPPPPPPAPTPIAAPPVSPVKPPVAPPVPPKPAGLVPAPPFSDAPSSSAALPAGAPIILRDEACFGTPDPASRENCNWCEGDITGVFVRVKGKNLHVECFKCATCGSSLKNVGYYSINEKLYCDIHARQVAVQYAPSADLEPIAVPPGAPIPVAKPVQPAFSPKPAAKPVQPAFSPKPAAPPASFSPRVTPKAPMLPPSPAPVVGPPSFASHKPEPTLLGGKIAGAVPFGSLPPSKVGPVPFHHSSMQMSHEVSSSSTTSEALGPLPPLTIPETSLPPGYSNASAEEREFANLLTELSKQGSMGISSIESTKSSQVVQEVKRMETSYSSSSTSAIGTTNAGPNRVIWPPPRSEEEGPAVQPGGGHHVSFAPTVEEQQVKEPVVKPVGSVGQTFPRAPSAVAPKPHPIPAAHPLPSFGGHDNEHLPGPGSKTMGLKWTPKKGKGVLSQAGGSRIPVCYACQQTIRGPFVTAMNKTWCPKDFVCTMPNCGRNLQDIGFVEEQDNLVCENCWGSFLAPECDKCHTRIKAECMKAIGKFFHPACFSCAYCKAPFGSDYFYLEDGLPYCETDWNELFTTKCFGCGFPIGAGDHWVEALNNSYHTQCFKCSLCSASLEGKGFFARAGRPVCKNHGVSAPKIH